MEAIEFSPEAAEELEQWKKSGNTIIMKRIRQLIQAIKTDPFKGIGKPEALKHNLSGYWSRRINQEHRLVYKVEGSTIFVISLRFHYN